MKKNLNKKTLHASKRTYFINQATIKEESIIEITESKSVAPNKYKRRTILIYEEDMDLIVEALQQLNEERKENK